MVQTNKHILLYSLAASLTLLTGASQAQEAKGWDRTVRVAEHLEPAIPHPTQEQAALEKLRQFEAKTGRKPNILIMLVDDMGYGDPGAFRRRSDAWSAHAEYRQLGRREG